MRLLFIRTKQHVQSSACLLAFLFFQNAWMGLSFLENQVLHSNRTHYDSAPQFRNQSTAFSNVSHQRIEKYFIFNHRIGRLNNQVQNYMVAFHWSSLLNRTLVIPGWDEHDCINAKTRIRYGNVPFEKYFEWDYLGAHYKKVIKEEEYKASVLRRLPQSEVVFLKQLKNARHGGLKNDGELLRVLKNISQVHLEVNVPYKWGVPQEVYLKFIRYFKPRQDVIEEAQRWTEKYLSRPYAAIHLRRWEGKCKMPVGEILQYIDNRYKKSEYKSFFVASDGQDKQLFNVVNSRYNGISYRNMSYLPGVYALGMVDSYILAFANLLFVNRFSSMSYNAYQNHFSLCKNPYSEINLCGDVPINPWCIPGGQLNPWCTEKFQVVPMKPINSSDKYAC
eukprot:TRINITY_DN3332_c0_g1_i1.p1 TRINITY_DN3332_c0_g1~~TRINITY_DN3332_c0_g1_i1.p1  ORF type:complete len:391 (-),score=43.23 TRINITY_DN3332_c0_g1_i1:609-1781(-)